MNIIASNFTLQGSLLFRIVTVLVLSLVTNQLHSQSIKFKRLSVEDGLSQNTVKSIIQDSRGFMWFGTSDGLNRYDGYSIKVYKNSIDDSTSLSSDEISLIFEDSKKRLWIGTDGGGINLFDRDKEIFKRYVAEEYYQTLSNDNIRAIAEDKKGNIWLATDWGINRLNPNSGKVLRFTKDGEDSTKIKFEAVFALEVDKNNNLWVGSWGQGLLKMNLTTYEKTYLNNNPNDKNTLANDIIWRLYFDKDSSLWIGTWGKGISRYFPKENKFIHYNKSNSSKVRLSNNYISGILRTFDGDIFVGTDGAGLNIISADESTVEVIKYNPSDQYSIAEDGIESIYQDKNGIIWMGSWGGGVSYSDLRQQKIKHYRKNIFTESSINHNEVRAFHLDEKDSNLIWIGTDGGGLNKFNFKDKSFEYYTHDETSSTDIGDNVILSIAEDESNNLWLGTYTKGLVKFNKRTGRGQYFSHNPNNEYSISKNFIRSIYFDNHKNMWIGTVGGGLNLFDIKNNKFYSYKQIYGDSTTISSNVLTFIYQDKDDIYWAGTWGGGLNKFYWDGIPGSEITFKQYKTKNSNIIDDRLIDIHEDKDGTFWIISTAGLIKFDKTLEKFEHFGEVHGISSNMIYGILEDDYNNLWLSTNAGITKFNKYTREIEVFTKDDGLQSNQFYMRAFGKGPKGTMFFGGGSGFNCFHPDSLKKNNTKPDIVFTGLKIFADEIKIGNKKNSILKKTMIETDTIKLNYDQNFLTIEFAALHYTSPQKNEFAYYLDGLENDYNYVGQRNFASYANLDPGNYTLKVKAANYAGFWNENSRNLTIIIKPPFWYTEWFISLMILVTLSLLYILYHLRMMSVMKYNKRLKEEVQERTLALENTNEELETLNKELESRVKERTEALLQAKNKAEKADRLKGEFLAQMSHEIRTPINVILNYTDIFKMELDDYFNEMLNDCYRGMKGAGKRVIRTIDLILNMSELQSGSYEYSPKEIDLDMLLKDMIKSEFSGLAKLKDLKLEYINEAKDSKIILDEYSVSQIFANVIDNAIKYTEHGKINIYLKRNEANIIVEIIDTGIGIEEEYLETLFVPFSQESQGYTRKFDGNGLGMALVKKYCELNKADIEVESEKGTGSKFTIKLPIKH